MAGLKRENVALNRKTLAALAAQEPLSFGALVRQVAAMRGGGSGVSAPPPPP
jgi:ribosomal protein L20